MLQIKERKNRYRNTDKKLKAAFRGRGFQGNSKTYQSIMNLTKQIIRHNGKIRTTFFRQIEKRGENNG